MRERGLIIAAALLLPTCAFAQLAAGKLLIATQKSRDPDLKQSVVLVIQYDKDAAVGLIVNRRSDVPASEAFPELNNAKGGPVPVWAGGPLAIGIRALHQSEFQPAEGREILAGLSLIFDKPLILKLLAASTPPDNFRVYAGYVGWTSQQLRNEVATGLWLVRAGDPAVVFDQNPETLWDRLTGKRPQH
jgi:putative transcriptional regulator